MNEKDEGRGCLVRNVAAIVGFAGVLIGVGIAVRLGATGRTDTGAADLLETRGRAPVVACTWDADEDGRADGSPCASPNDAPLIPASLSGFR